MKWDARRGGFHRLLGRINRLTGGTAMNKELLNKANNLMHDIENISKIVNERENSHHWITVIAPNHKDSYYSCRFMDELTEWMKKKREEYKKEFEQLK